MYPSAITHIVAAQIEEQRYYREAERARAAKAAQPERRRLTRTLTAIGKTLPAASFAPWLAGRS